MLDLYRNIKMCRLSRGWSQTDLANKVGYSDKSMISKIERGAVDLSQSQIVRFAEVFCVSPADLFGDTDAPAAAPSLSSDRIDLLEKYDVLNDEGKAEAVRYIGMLGSVPAYTEEHADIKRNA